MKSFIPLVVSIIAIPVGNCIWEVIKCLWRFRKTKTFEIIKYDLLAGFFGLTATFVMFWIFLGRAMSIDVCMLLGVVSCFLYICQYNVEKRTSRLSLEKLLFDLFFLTMLVNVKVVEILSSFRRV